MPASCQALKNKGSSQENNIRAKLNIDCVYKVASTDGMSCGGCAFYPQEASSINNESSTTAG
ncbi:hypothetical protein HMPREF9455_00218 [Dysgonomonas gadei ATCC BAA-286]|jgi:hypothetical protein|uniref:Uncharacterized protein n=1 Tax=Dysgonomonas gadei ATCC BAA-286 TaxID=742766 RepID=F5IT01_9BACT|nr:hypothetical protein HMPREF9455_00218 [Dysgonomonas gadei ATCC BAA-286]